MVPLVVAERTLLWWLKDIPTDKGWFLFTRFTGATHALGLEETLLACGKGRTVETMVRWEMPSEARVFLNNNRASKGNPRVVACGGVIHSGQGK